MEEVASKTRNNVPIWEKYMLTIDEAAAYFGIGTDRLRRLATESLNTSDSFLVQVGVKYLINRHKFEKFLDKVTAV